MQIWPLTTEKIITIKNGREKNFIKLDKTNVGFDDFGLDNCSGTYAFNGQGIQI